jgi:hypothetical protein
MKKEQTCAKFQSNTILIYQLFCAKYILLRCNFIKFTPRNFDKETKKNIIKRPTDCCAPSMQPPQRMYKQKNSPQRLYFGLALYTTTITKYTITAILKFPRLFTANLIINPSTVMTFCILSRNKTT